MQKLLKTNKWIKYIFIIASGILTCLPMMLDSLGFLQWVTMSLGAAVLLLLARDESVGYGAMYKYGFVYFLSFYLTAFCWFVSLYPLSFIDGMTELEAAVVVACGWVGLSLLQTIFSALWAVVLAVACRRGTCKEKKWLTPIVAAASYIVFEWAQTLTWAGVPWARLAIGQAGLPVMIKSASLLGSYLVSFLIVLVNFLLAELLLTDCKKQKRMLVCAAALVVAINGAIGAIMIALDTEKGESFTAAAIQPNISSHEKWSNDTTVIKERVEKYVIEAANAGAELVVLPETVFPGELLDKPGLKLFVRSLAIDHELDMVVGCFTTEDGESKNSLIFIDKEGNISDVVYSKRHLVPFGEYVPMREVITALIPPLAELTMFEDLSPGEDSAVYSGRFGNIGALVCFDSIYEQLTLDSVRDGAEIIVLGTNDSWFYDSAGVRMHNAQARLRAVESGRCVVRAANTGISSVIDHNGKELDREEALIEGFAIAEVYSRSAATVYSCVGNVIIWLSMAFVVGCIFGIKCKHKTKNIDILE